MTYSSGLSQREEQSPHRMRSNALASLSTFRSFSMGGSSCSESVRSALRMAFPHLRDPRGSTACAIRSNVKNAVLRSPILSSPTSRPKRNLTGNVTNESTPNSCKNTFPIQADFPPSGLDVVTYADHPPIGAFGHAGATATLHPSSRHPFTETGAGALYAQRPISLVQAREYQSSGFFSVVPRQVGKVFSITSSNRERSEFASSRPHDPTQRFRKQRVGGFHAQSLVSSPVLGAFT